MGTSPDGLADIARSSGHPITRDSPGAPARLLLGMRLSLRAPPEREPSLRIEQVAVRAIHESREFSEPILAIDSASAGSRSRRPSSSSQIPARPAGAGRGREAPDESPFDSRHPLDACKTSCSPARCRHRCGAPPEGLETPASARPLDPLRPAIDLPKQARDRARGALDEDLRVHIRTRGEALDEGPHPLNRLERGGEVLTSRLVDAPAARASWNRTCPRTFGVGA